MRKDRSELAYIWDMLEAANYAIEFAAGQSFHHFEQDDLLRSALERKIEIIGEAARRISKEFQQDHPEIDWKKIIGLRHLLAHEYGEIKLEVLWTIAIRDVPELAQKLRRILESESP
ncbi:MAG: DUF86 domain-containing protein [bacterium]